MPTARFLSVLSALFVSAALVAACRPGGVDGGLHPPSEVRNQIERNFLGVQGRFAEAHIQACLAERRSKGAKFTAVGNPIYQPNYFYTCVANTDMQTQKVVEHKPGNYNISYEVHVPIAKPDMMKTTAAPAGDKWFYWTRCDFAVAGEAITYRRIDNVDLFVPEMPMLVAGGKVRHFCMQMPNADHYLTSAQKNTVYKHVYKKPGEQTAALPGQPN